MLASKTDFSAAQYEKVLAKPDVLGLPSYANGNAEGYLFPSTYDLGPKETPKSILKAMVRAGSRPPTRRTSRPRLRSSATPRTS